MTNKKLICFPFINGSLQEYSFYNLSDDEIERIYNGEHIESQDGTIWKPNEEIYLRLHYDGYGRGRSSVTFYWKDDNGHRYPMFLTDMNDLLKQNVGVSNIYGIFTYVRRGANYGVKLLKLMR
jgi:hypothetical protein